MSISIPGRVIVFDYGEVISLSPSAADTAALVEVAGVDGDAFWPVYWQHREALDQGTMSVREYWTVIAAELGVTWSDAERHELWVRDFRSWFSADPGTVGLIGELRAGGSRLALLSNAGFDFADAFRNAPFSEGFERVFVSAELGMVKPHADIYEHVADELGIGFDEFVFVDNKAENVEALVALGGTGHVFTGADGLRTFLTGLAAQAGLAAATGSAS